MVMPVRKPSGPSTPPSGSEEVSCRGFPPSWGAAGLPAQGGARCQPMSPCPPRPPAPGLMLHAGSGQSDSSGFAEEPVPGQLPAAQLHGTDQTA